MTKGSPWRLIAGFALPVLLSQIFQQLYNTADTLIVGRFLGDGALAAVSSSGPLIFLLVSFFEGLTLGAGARGIHTGRGAGCGAASANKKRQTTTARSSHAASQATRSPAASPEV